MLFIGLIIISILALQTIQTAISPATLKAMAAIQAHKARALANALRARTHFNMARAKTNLGLIDHRIIRNSDDQLVDHDLEYDEENFPYLLEDYYEEINLPDTDEDIDRVLSSDSKLQQSQSELDNLVNGDEKIISLDSDVAYGYGENSNIDNNLQIPLNIGELDESNNLDCGVTTDNQDSSQTRREALPLGCERPFYDVNSRIEDNVDPTLGMQPFSQAYTPGQPQLAQQIVVPWQLVPQGIPAMQIVPQASPFANFPIQPISGLPPGYAPQMVFLRQATFSDKDKSKHFDSQKSSTPQTVSSSRKADPKSLGHTHTHTHTHTYTHFREPHRNIQIPNTQIITPGLNLHVIQNQNSQQIPAVPIQPRLYNAQGRPVQINPGCGTYNSVPIPPSTISNGLYQGGQSSGYGVVGPGISAGQSQFIQTNVPTNKQSITTSNSGGSSFTQSQTIHQGGPVVGITAKDKPIEYLEQLNLPYSEPDLYNQKIGSTITDIRLNAQESPKSFNPDQRQNLQPIVTAENRLLYSPERHENIPYQFGTLHNEFEYVRSPNYYEEKLGTFPSENIHINPIPLPENFLQLNPEERQIAMEIYLDEERMNLKNLLEQIDKTNRRNLEKLSDLIDTSPIFTPNPVGFQKDENNLKDVQAEITRSPQYNVENTKSSPEGTFYDDITNLGHIIDVPQTRESQWFQRLSRSLNQTDGDKLDKLLLAEKSVINELKKDAKHDEDLMMIGYIGESMIKDLEKGKNETKRTKREIAGSPYNSGLNRLILDPRTKLDIPKTLDNLGAVVKNTFEHENAPLYHVRNMMGSAQDAVLATMKIPTKNFLIPSQYDIVKREESNAIVGDINPNLFSEKYSQEKCLSDNISNTFHKVGSAVRGSVLSGQEALSHVGQVANHAKNAIHSTRYTTPRLMLTKIPAVSRDPIRKAVLITPRIFDVASESQPVVNKLDNSEEGFIMIGDILDSVGVSNPNSNDLYFEKIIMEPSTFSIFNSPAKSAPSKLLGNFLKNVRDEDINSKDKDLSNTLRTLNKVKESFGVDSLKDFFAAIKGNLKEILDTAQKENIKLSGHTEQETKTLPTNQIPSQENNHVVNRMSRKQEDFSHNEKEQLDNKGNVQKPKDRSQMDGSLGQILEAINPVMFEKLFNESVQSENNVETPHSVLPDENGNNQEEINNEKIGTSMQFSEAMLKPFMGQASNKTKHDFFHKYMADTGDESESKGHQKTTEMSEWMKVDFHQGNELEK